MTAQEIFETVSRHLFAQGTQARELDVCRYRAFIPATGETLKCAVGCLIPDEAYRPTMEGYRVSAVIGKLPDAQLADLFNQNYSLLSTLQRVHDFQLSETVSSAPFRKALRKVGNAYDLDTAFLEELEFSDEARRRPHD